MRRLFFPIAFITLATAPLFGGVANTKHNLSSLNTVNTIHATPSQTASGVPVEKEICVYCHIPHSAQSIGAPLWNRSMPENNYIMYTSDYLIRANYPFPDDVAGLGTDGGRGSISRQCLSCHDGTIAVGSIHVGGGISRTGSPIAMEGTTGGYMTAANMGYIGTDLTKHHPVGIEYDPTITLSLFDDGTRPIELKDPIDTNGSQNSVKLYNYGTATSYVECASCHNPHTENTKFLRIDGGSHAQNIKQTCVACHDKTNWVGSVHDTETVAYTDTTVTDHYGLGTTVADLGCANCHTPHKGDGVPYLTRKVEENTCFRGANSDADPATTCHGSNSANVGNRIQPLFETKDYGHPVTDATYTGRHTNLDFLYGENDPTKDGVDWTTNDKHVECVDCHNQHQARKGTHVDDNSTTGYPATVNANSNLISNSPALTGATGIEPVWPSKWSQPVSSSFQKLDTADKEYQICMKCHSSWALGSSTSGVTGFAMDVPNSFAAVGEASSLLTDQAWEFNPNNRAAHPVVMTTNQMGTLSGWNVANGRYADPLPAAALKDPWSANVGDQTMYCSDCHGSDNELGGDPKGPHGSNRPFMLKGVSGTTYWPKNSAGNLFTMSDGQANDPEIFCLNCHNYTAVAVHQTSRAKMREAFCINCHIAVPHGGPVSRLIGYITLPAPYDYNDNSLQIDGFRWNNTNQRSDVYSTHGNCATGSCHGTNAGGYDTIP